MPMLCKLAADGLVRSLADMEPSVGKDSQVVLVSFDPRDTPQQAATTREQLIHRYGRTGTEDGWHCLTGDESVIQSLTNRVGFHYVWDEETKQYAHAAGLFLISPEGSSLIASMVWSSLPSNLPLRLQRQSGGSE
ncbi:MAG: SCO family protein [Planctomycetaceae bacterium]